MSLLLPESSYQSRSPGERTWESRVSKVTHRQRLKIRFHSIWLLLWFFSYSTENQEKEDKPKEEEAKEPLVEEKPRTRSAQPKEAAPAFMSTLFAMMDVYMNKMLVRPRNHDGKTFSALASSFPKLFYHLGPDIDELCQLKVGSLFQSSPFSFRTTWLATSTTCASWLSLCALLSTSFFSSTR